MRKLLIVWIYSWELIIGIILYSNWNSIKRHPIIEVFLLYFKFTKHKAKAIAEIIMSSSNIKNLLKVCLQCYNITCFQLYAGTNEKFPFVFFLSFSQTIRHWILFNRRKVQFPATCGAPIFQFWGHPQSGRVRSGVDTPILSCAGINGSVFQ